jgi:hypothetical protein
MNLLKSSKRHLPQQQTRQLADQIGSRKCKIRRRARKRKMKLRRFKRMKRRKPKRQNKKKRRNRLNQ